MGNPNRRPAKKAMDQERKHSDVPTPAASSENSTAPLSSVQYVKQEPAITTETKRCTACERTGHIEEGCFIVHPKHLLDYLSRYPETKPYWDRQVKKYQAKLGAERMSSTIQAKK